MIEVVSSSQTSVSIYQITPCNIPEDSHLHRMHSLCEITKDQSNIFQLELLKCIAQSVTFHIVRSRPISSCMPTEVLSNIELSGSATAMLALKTWY
jgi:hypothetical protein